MTVHDWITARAADAPVALRERLGQALGPDGASDVTATTGACLAGAERMLRQVLEERRFDRSGALDLLAADALATYAYEYASEVSTPGELLEAAQRGVATLGRLADAHV